MEAPKEVVMSTVEHRPEPRNEPRNEPGNKPRNEPLSPDPPSPPRQRRERRAAIGLGVAGLVVAAVALLVPDSTAAEVCWTAGFALLFLALVMVVVRVVHARGERLSVLPSSVAGWAALACVVVGVALILTPVGEVSLLLGVAAAALGVGAVTVRRERALPVIMLPLFAGSFVLAFLLGELLLGHE
ncbi:hypothetical protein ACXR8F_07630 [Terrabacter sp. AAH1]